MAVTLDEVSKLSTLVWKERAQLLAAWRTQVKTLPSAEHLDIPTLNDHIPGLIEEIARALLSGTEETIAETIVEGTPPAHGAQRYEDGFDIEEVVAEYNILRGCVHDLADHNGVQLQGAPFRVLNRVLDGAIGAAVQAFAAQRAREVQQRREEYLAFVAHDLRTPLNAISLAMNYLKDAPPQRDTRAENNVLWNIMRRNVQQLEVLVGRILKENVNFEAEAGFKLEPRLLDLWALVESVRADLQPIAQSASVRVINEVPTELLVFADASMVRRVFQNLIVNAISYAPQGKIEICAKQLDGGQSVECWVLDDGAGIPAQRIASIFDKLESGPGRNGSSGLGLGLAIVKAFVEAHGGEVVVESKEGEGCLFRFSLPAHAP
ncbi:MAG: HAMP domain-containing sensor histidine kinase [Arenimonas sp.]